MNNIVNRQPVSFNIPKDNLQTFNMTQFKGIDNNKNFSTVDQLSFNDANNVFVDENYLLRSRKALGPSFDSEFIIKVRNLLVQYPDAIIYELRQTLNMIILKKLDNTFIISYSDNMIETTYYSIMIIEEYSYLLTDTQLVLLPNAITNKNLYIPLESENTSSLTNQKLYLTVVNANQQINIPGYNKYYILNTKLNNNEKYTDYKISNMNLYLNQEVKDIEEKQFDATQYIYKNNLDTFLRHHRVDTYQYAIQYSVDGENWIDTGYTGFDAKLARNSNHILMVTDGYSTKTDKFDRTVILYDIETNTSIKLPSILQGKEEVEDIYGNQVVFDIIDELNYFYALKIHTAEPSIANPNYLSIIGKVRNVDKTYLELLPSEQNTDINLIQDMSILDYTDANNNNYIIMSLILRNTIENDLRIHFGSMILTFLEDIEIPTISANLTGVASVDDAYYIEKTITLSYDMQNKYNLTSVPTTITTNTELPADGIFVLNLCYHDYTQGQDVIHTQYMSLLNNNITYHYKSNINTLATITGSRRIMIGITDDVFDKLPSGFELAHNYSIDRKNQTLYFDLGRQKAEFNEGDNTDNPYEFLSWGDIDNNLILIEPFYTNDNIVFAMDKFTLTLYSNKQVNVYSYTENITEITSEPIDHFLEFSDVSFLSKNNILYIAENKVNLPDTVGLYINSIPEFTFPSKITGLQKLSKTELLIFLENEMWYGVDISTDEGRVFQYRKLRIPLGKRNEDMSIISLDGKYIIWRTDRGLVGMTYEALISTNEQFITYLSDTIINKFNEFAIQPGIKLFNYKYWLIVYRIQDGKMLWLDLRSNAWFEFTYPEYLIPFIDKEQLNFIGSKNIYREKEDTEKYQDDWQNISKIDWHFITQKLHFGAVNNYKSITRLWLTALQGDTTEKKYNMQLGIYNNGHNYEVSSAFEYNIDLLKVFRKVLNLFHTNAIELSLSSTKKTKDGYPLLLSNLGIEYRITEKVRGV